MYDLQPSGRCRQGVNAHVWCIGDASVLHWRRRSLTCDASGRVDFAKTAVHAPTVMVNGQPASLSQFSVLPGDRVQCGPFVVERPGACGLRLLADAAASAETARLRCGCREFVLSPAGVKDRCALDGGVKSAFATWQNRSAFNRYPLPAELREALYTVLKVLRGQCECDGKDHSRCHARLMALVGGPRALPYCKVTCMYFRPQAVTAMLEGSVRTKLRFYHHNWTAVKAYLMAVARSMQGRTACILGEYHVAFGAIAFLQKLCSAASEA